MRLKRRFILNDAMSKAFRSREQRQDGLAFDPAEALRVLAKADRRMKRLISKVGPYTMRPPKRLSPFQILLRSIAGQQLSGKAAATIHGRVCDLFPRERPTEALMASMEDQKLRDAGLSWAKVASVKDLAEKTVEGLVPTRARLKRIDDDAIVERLTEIRGIGRWTVEMMLMFYLGRPDLFPVDDLGIQKGHALVYGLKKPLAGKKLLPFGEPWRPYRSVASWYFWRALEQEGDFKNIMSEK